MNRVGRNDIRISFADPMRLAALDALAAEFVRARCFGIPADDQGRSPAHHIHEGSKTLMAAPLGFARGLHRFPAVRRYVEGPLAGRAAPEKVAASTGDSSSKRGVQFRVIENGNNSGGGIFLRGRIALPDRANRNHCQTSQDGPSDVPHRFHASLCVLCEIRPGRLNSIGRQGLKPSVSRWFDVVAEEAAEELKTLSF